MNAARFVIVLIFVYAMFYIGHECDTSAWWFIPTQLLLGIVALLVGTTAIASVFEREDKGPDDVGF